MKFKDIPVKQFKEIVSDLLEVEFKKFTQYEDTGILTPNIKVISNQLLTNGRLIKDLAYITNDSQTVNIKCFEVKNVKLIYGFLVKSNIFENVNININNDEIELKYPFVTLERKEKLINIIKKHSLEVKDKLQQVRLNIKKEIDKNDNKDEKKLHLKNLDEVIKLYNCKLDVELEKKIKIIQKI